jgi:hypothetical protein
MERTQFCLMDVVFRRCFRKGGGITLILLLTLAAVAVPVVLALAFGAQSDQSGKVSLEIDQERHINFLAQGEEADPFTVRLMKEGEPLAGCPVEVSSTFGILARPLSP